MKAKVLIEVEMVLPNPPAGTKQTPASLQVWATEQAWREVKATFSFANSFRAVKVLELRD